ncbi:lipase 1-like [Cimex lectularius]|uniref:Lipase n=1 Tax=Cimex lectularius TaxID=79782 RepID=A0A8I6RLH2_CIMLE|nr:lipase 1-like [Cimex lectularius]
MSYISFIVPSVLLFIVYFTSGQKSDPPFIAPNDYYSLSLSNRELIERAGYNYEFHEAVTDDGYLVGLHRIMRRDRPSKGHPVLLVNGFCIRSRSWILRGKGIDFPFILADHGYDVWLGDQRGNPYSRKHLKYSFTDSEYWNFSFHEIGSYDLPAMINQVLNVSSKEKLSYVGQSLGSSFYFAMMSEREEFNRKVASSVHFAPLVIPPNASELTILHRVLLQILSYLLKWLRSENVIESHNKYFMRIVALALMKVCDRSPLQTLCVISLPWIVGGSMDHFDQEHLGFQMGASIGLTSFKTGDHMIQMYFSGKFRKYDYGMEENLKLYGCAEPAAYNISKVSSPTALFIAEQDALVPYHVSRKTVDALGRYAYPFLMKGFNHFEMALGRRAVKTGYIKALNFINKVFIF